MSRGRALPTRPTTFRPHAQPTRQEVNREVDQRRGSAASRGYDSAWVKASKGHRRRHPLCRYCEVGAFDGEPRTTGASLTDHLYPHRGDRDLFWCSALWVSSCKPCHDGPKQATERQGDVALDQLARRIGYPLKCEVL